MGRVWGGGLWCGHGCRPALRLSGLLEGPLTRGAVWGAPALRVAVLLSERGRHAGGCGQWHGRAAGAGPGSPTGSCPDATSQAGRGNNWRPAGGGSALMGSMLSLDGPHLCVHMRICIHTHTRPCTGPKLGVGRGRSRAGRAKEVTPCSCSSGPWGAAGCLWVLQGEPWRAWRASPWPWPARPSSFLQWQRPLASGWSSYQGVGGHRLLEAL